MQFKVERWRDVEAEMLDLIEPHWRELAMDRDKIPLDVNCDGYREMDERGTFNVVTVRDNGRLVGYYCSHVLAHPHYQSTISAFDDGYFVLPEYRRGTVGMNLLDSMERAVKVMGAKVILSSYKKHFNLGPLFRLLGYAEMGTQVRKWIGD